jgi:hypothetical protein
MPEHILKKVRLFVVFYKSTLMLSISFAAVMSAFAMLSSPAIIIRMFGVSLMTGGTIVSLLYKETTLKHEYYFYYNQAISKTALLAVCILVNAFIGTFFIISSFYV